MINPDALVQINHIKKSLESLLAKDAKDLKETASYLWGILYDIKQFKRIMQNKTLDTEIDKIGKIADELLSDKVMKVDNEGKKTLTIDVEEFDRRITTMLGIIKNIISQTSIPSSVIVHTQATSLEPKKYYSLELSEDTIKAIKLAIDKLASEKPAPPTLGGERKSRKSGRTARRTARKTRRR
jgi:hypothetical protein